MYDYVYEPDKTFLIATINDIRSYKVVYLFNNKQYNFIKNIIANDSVLKTIEIKENKIDGIYALIPEKTKRRNKIK